jgi:hypothetical protein
MKREVGKFLLISLSGLVLLNITIIGASIAFQNYGRLTLNPGENYTINIPFIGNKQTFQTICGKAEQTDGTALKNISVILKEYNSNETIAENTTGSDGKYCITIPRLSSSTKFDIYLEYENDTGEENLTLADHDYYLNFDDDKNYSKAIDDYVILTGDITNEYAKVENGRFEIKVAYNDKEPGENNSWEYIFGDFEKYFINIGSNETYELPNEEVNISWQIPYDASPGEYKFYIKTSFNAEEKSKYVFFNIEE